MCSDTDPDLIQQLLLKHWKLEKPSVIISITGSAQDIVLESALEAMIRQGIARAAQATRRKAAREMLAQPPVRERRCTRRHGSST